MPACDGRTDGRTDGQTDVKPIAITCFSIADARKNHRESANHQPIHPTLNLTVQQHNSEKTAVTDTNPPIIYLPLNTFSQDTSQLLQLPVHNKFNRVSAIDCSTLEKYPTMWQPWLSASVIT